MGAKITKAARRERNSGSADAKAAYLPLSKPFVIPRKKAKQGLFQEVSLQSREFLKDILPIITKQYRSKDAENRFTFTKAQLIHNEELTRTFHERRKEMKDEGRTEKELMESYAFIATDNNKAAEKMCQDGVSATGGHVAPLGNPKMGVYLSRYADIIKREGLESGHQGILIILKILKGRVKAMPLNYTSVLEPIPNYDSHVAKSSALDMTKLSSLQTPMAFDATQIYLYEFGELDMVKRPRQVCPYAVVSYTYQEPVKASPATVPLSQPLLQQETRDSVVQGTSSANHHHAQSMPPLAPLASTPAKPDIPRLDPTKKVTTDKPTTTPSLSQIENLRKNHFLVWKGMLCAKSEPLCSACMISFTSPVLPQILPAVINFKTKISFAKMHAYFPSGIFASGIPLTSNIREVCRRNKYVVYCELQHNQESTQRYQQLLQFMLLNQAVLKCRLEGNVTMFVFPTSTLSHDLGVTRGDYPETLHVLFTARSPMIGHIAEKGIYIPSGTKVQTPIADNQLLEGSDNKQLMLRIGLLSMFTRQSHDLKHQTDIRSPEASSIHSPAQGGSDALTPLSVDRTSTVAVKSKVIDYQHGLLSKKDLLSTYRSQKMQVTDNQGSNHPFQPGFVNRSPLPSEVPNVHPMYSSPASTLNIQADPVPEGSLHPMYNISETLAAPASSDGVSKKQPHPVYNPQGHPQSPSIMEAVHEENVHPMYSQHLEPSRGDQKSSSTDLLARDTWLGPTSSGSPGTAAVGVQREPPQVSRQSSKLPLGSILDQQAEITRLQEEMRILRRHKEISAGGPALEECYNAKLTKLQDFLQALRQERSRLNQEEDGRVQMEGLEDTRREQHSGDRPVGEDEVTEKLDVFSSPEVKAVESCAPQSSPLLTDTSKDLPGSSVSPALSTKVMEVVQQIAKLPVKPTQNNPEVSVQTLKAVIEKVLISPSTENTTGEGIAKSGPTFPVSIPLSMLSSGKPSDDAPGLVGHQSALKPGQGEADESGEVSQNDESGGGSRLSEKGQVKPPSNPFGDALASMDHYSLSGRASKKLKRSHSKEFGEKSEQDSKLGTEEKPITEERCNKESLSLDLNLARKVIPNFDPQADGLSSPIRGASEMKAFLNGGVVHTKDRITSATDMKSYLNKKLLDSEHEKTDRTRKGGGGSASLKRGKLSKERTIEEIDNEIRRLNKEKERLKSQFARKRNSSGGSISDKPKKLPFINSVDLKGLGRIPKKKMPSPERVEGASAFSNQTKLSAERTVDNQGGLSIGSAKGSSQDSLEGTVSLSTGIAGLTEGVTGIPDCPSDKSSYQVCSKEMQLSGGKEKGLFATGQDGSGRTLYMVVLTRKFLEGGLKEEEWSGTSLQHCISDTLHRGARFDNTKETEEERFFSQNAAAAIRKVFAKQTAEDQTIRQVTEDYQQTVTFNSDGESKSSQKPEGFSDAKEDSSPTLGQNVVDPNTETSNTEDKELVAPEETVIVVSNGENSRDEPASPIKEPSVVSHKTEDSQEGQKALSGSPSTDLTEPVRTTDLDSNVKLEDTKEQNSTGKPGIRDGLVINDGACFFGDLESEEGVCVNFDLEEDSVTDQKSPSEPTPDLQPPVSEGPTSFAQKESKDGNLQSASTVEENAESLNKLSYEEEVQLASLTSTDRAKSKADPPSESKTLPQVDPVRDGTIGTLGIESVNPGRSAAKDAVPSGDSGLESEVITHDTKSVLIDKDSAVTETPVVEVSKCDSTTDEPTLGTSLKAESSLKESRASHRHHPYERKRWDEEEEEEASGQKYSKHLAVPELEKLMQNYTIAAYKDRPRSRRASGPQPDYDHPRHSPARFRDVAREFSRGKAENSKEDRQDVKTMVAKQQKKKTQLQELERKLTKGPPGEMSETAYEIEMRCYEDQVKSGHQEGSQQDQAPTSNRQAPPSSRGEASQPSSVAASPTCQTETSSIGAASTTGSRVSLPTSCSDNNTFSGSSNNSSKCFSIASRCSFDNSSSFGNNDRFSYNSNGSSSDNSTCSSNTNINSSVSSSSKLAGAGGGSSNNQLTEKGGIKPQLITSTANQDISLQSLKPEQVKMAHENRTRSPSNLLQVVNQQLNPVKTHPVTSKKESCLLSCSINAARDPRIRRLHNQPTPPSSSQAGPQKTSLQTAVSSSPAESTPLAQKEALETAPCATQNSSSAPVTSRKPPSLSNRPAKSILKGGQNPTSFVTVDSENRPSSPPCEQTLSGSSDASRKVKISLSQYKGKADPRSKVPPDKVEIGREEGQPKSSCTGMCKVEPSADIKQIVFLPPHQNIKITLSGDSVRSILLPEKQNRKDKPDSEDLDAVGMNMNGADEQEPGRTSTDHALPSGKPALKLQNGNKKDLRMVVDQSSPQSSAPSSEANNLLATQPNLVITIPRDGSGESTPSDMTETGVVPNDRQLTDDTATTTVTTFPESREVSLETSITLTQLELEDSIFNLTADAVGNTTAEETHKREHLNKLSPNSISRRLQSIKYELEAFWSELRKLDMPDELQVDEALPTDPRRCNLHNSRKLTQNGEFGENDLTAWAANDILADITSELSACLNSTRVLKEEQSQVSECLSKHLPKFSKLRGMAMSPRMNGSSPQESSNKLSSINEFISGLREEFCRRVEDICFSAADYSSPEKVVEVRAESESSVHSLDKDLVKKIQQMLTAARAQASLVQENSKEPEGTVKIEKASENTATLELKTNYSLNTNLSLLSSKEKVTKEVEMAEVGVESSSSPLKEKPEKSMETEKGKEVQVKGKSRSSVPERKSASSSPQASPDSCKWGKFKMKLWGKRPTKQRKIMKATWIKVEKPKPSSEVSTELSTKAECDTTSDDTKDPVVKEDDRDGDTEECKERKLSVSEEQAVEEMCAKLLGDEKALSEEKLAVTGTIPTLLNRTTSHASSVAKRSSSGPASLKTAAGFSRPQGQVKQGVVLQPGQYQPPYNPQGHVNPVKAQSQQSQAVHATGQYSLNGASCQGYFQQHPSHPNLQLPGYVQQQVPSNFLSSCQQNPNSIQQQYANYGYGSGSAQGMTSVRPPIVSSEMRHWHSGVGPLQTNTGVGPANMGPRPTSMGPEHSNMGLGPNNLAPGPKNTGLGPNNMGPGPNSMGPGPNNMGLCVNNIGTGPASIGQRPTNMTPGPNNMGSGPNNIGPGSNNMGQGITNSIGQGSTNVGPGPGSIIPGPRNMGSGPINRMPGPTNTVPGPSSIVPGPSNMGSSPINRMPGPTNMGPGHHFFGPGAYNSGPNNFGYGSNYMSPGPNSMGPGANNIGAGPNSVGPSPSRGPGPNNLAPGTYNIGPGAYNMDSVPCNAGPRLNQPVRQQPPVPGLDCEGVNTGLAVCEDLVDNTYHGKSSEAHVGQCDSELTDHSESRDTLVVVKQVSFQEPEENAHVPVSEALVPVPSPFLRPRVLEATDKCCARSLETSVEPVEGKVVGSKTSPEGSMEICIFEAAVPQFSETCIIEDAKVSASLKLTKMLDVKEVSPKVAEEDKGGQLNSYIVSRLEQQDVRAPSEMSGTMIDNLDESSTLLDSRRKSSSTEKQTESDKSPRESESFFLALLEVVQWRVFLTSRNKTRQQM
ncbi:uncharacterized protein LOC110982150 isoform X2 [Acanthaster planci]|uniref:Uncharacterized protein LOC110982150 isoform X2 n=1 Tax=Acanthaster planci TaxID=133434 RepID=A0A8B7YTP2_ACAPL|nr:uncharacterized protein LOC110982150 isoform X2 [Acanthaster planci]